MNQVQFSLSCIYISYSKKLEIWNFIALWFIDTVHVCLFNRQKMVQLYILLLCTVNQNWLKSFWREVFSNKITKYHWNEMFQPVEFVYFTTNLSIIWHPCNGFHCVIRHAWISLYFDHFLYLFALYNPTPCLFRLLISLPVNIRLDGFHCIYREIEGEFKTRQIFFIILQPKAII